MVVVREGGENEDEVIEATSLRCDDSDAGARREGGGNTAVCVLLRVIESVVHQVVPFMIFLTIILTLR
jgi:hypothetical protein